MIDLEQYLYDRVTPIIRSWNEDGIYAISFFVYSNEAFEYRGYTNVSSFEISYNTEGCCNHASALSEERWNYAFWSQNEAMIICPDNDDAGSKCLFEWYEQEGIVDIGVEGNEKEHDESGKYIGKGPKGYYELLTVVSRVARRIQAEGLLKEQFGKSLPIIVHDLEYPWFVEEATAAANPNGEADLFLEALSKGFPE